MLYAGAMERGFWIKEYAEEEGLDFVQVAPTLRINQHVNAILKKGQQDYTIFDIQQYMDKPSVIADQIEKICAANSSKAIILASGYSAKNEIVMALWDIGIRYFVFSASFREMKDELEKCRNGYFDVAEVGDIKQALEEKEQEELKSVDVKMIGIAGACRRIGTTTHAMQIIKYLASKGYKAAYIQINSTHYIENIREWFQYEDSDPELGCIRYQGIDHFYLPGKIPEVLKQGYDFYMFDYGTHSDPNFNRAAFLEKDYRIFIVGSDPSELSSTYSLMRSAFYDSVKYIFNFVSVADREDIDELVGDKRKDTYLAGYIPDKYVLADAEIYDRIISCMKPIKTQKTVKRWNGIFRK